MKVEPNASSATAGTAKVGEDSATSPVEVARKPAFGKKAVAMNSRAASVNAISAGAAEELKRTPTLADLQSLTSGDLSPAAVEKALHTALISTDPATVAKAAATLQVAESYQRKAKADAVNYAGTGFLPFSFPTLNVKLSAAETEKLAQRLSQGGDRATADRLALAVSSGLLRTSPPDAIRGSPSAAILPGSDGREVPRAGASFQEEWRDHVAPGLEHIEEAIMQTAKARGPTCPFARGNHAKGIAFDNLEMKLDRTAPAWAKELLGDSLKGGMLRVSGSQTDPDEPDSAAHQVGLRLVFPVKGALDGSATQLIDLTANTGSTTHAKTAAEHTRFTQNISVPKPELGGIFGWKPIRAGQHLLDAALGPGTVLERIEGMKDAVSITDQVATERFHEHDFFGRHAFFVGGRYVQVRFEVVEPKDFADPHGSGRPNARLDAVSDKVAQKGMKLAMFVTELPPGADPKMIEQEGWTGLPETRLATITVPPQQQTADSKAAKWFDDVPHIPAGKDKIFHGVGLARHRVRIYEQSGKVRHRPRVP